jgi:hypothetical protein
LPFQVELQAFSLENSAPVAEDINHINREIILSVERLMKYSLDHQADLTDHQRIAKLASSFCRSASRLFH